MDEHVIKTYKRFEPVFAKGDGALLLTEDGTEYLDFLGGIAVSALGHGHPRLVAALQDQAAQVLHVSNLFRHRYTEDVAARGTLPRTPSMKTSSISPCSSTYMLSPTSPR